MMESVIVYRNPLEAWLWESGAGWWLSGVMVVVVLAWFAFVASRMTGRRRR